MDSPKLRVILGKVLFVAQLTVSILVGVSIVFPVLFCLFILNELVRGVIRIGLWIFYGDKIKLSEDPYSSNYATLSSEQQRTVLYLAEVEGPLEVESLRENYQKHVIENPGYSRLTYNWKQHWQFMCMKKCENFDIKNHVRVYPGTEERTVTQKELMEDILPDLSWDMKDPNKPQWEEVLIPSFQPTLEESYPKKSLRMIRMHHSYMDGASTLLMLANLMSDDKENFPYVIDPCKPLKISWLSKFLYKLSCIALFGWHTVLNLISPPYTRATRFRVEKYSDKKLFALTKPIPIEYFKTIKEKSGVGMPAILTTVIAGAVRNLEVRYPSTKNIKNGIYAEPEAYPVWVVAGMFPYAKDFPCNNHTVIETFMNISDVTGCQRLTSLNEELGRSARNPKVTIYHWYQYLIGKTFTEIGRFFLELAVVDIILSNVPLSTRKVKLWGKECSHVVGWVPMLSGVGLGLVSVRYDDHFRYCLQADSSVINREELDYLVSEIELQVEELCLETMSLKRKISTDTSLFEREKEGEKELMESNNSDDEAKEKLSSNNNNNYNQVSNNELSGGRRASFLSKLKDSIEQIREGVKKIKEA